MALSAVHPGVDLSRPERPAAQRARTGDRGGAQRLSRRSAVRSRLRDGAEARGVSLALGPHPMRAWAHAAYRRRDLHELAQDLAGIARVDDFLDPEGLGAAEG